MIGLTVVHHVAVVTGQDSRGNDIRTWTPETIQALAWVPGQTSEDVQGTEQVTANGELYLPFGTVVAAEDRFEVYGETWEVNGHDSKWQSPFTGIPGATMTRLRRITGAGAHTVQA